LNADRAPQLKAIVMPLLLLFDETMEVKMITKRLALVIMLGCLIIFLPNNANGQSTLKENQVKCSITLEDSSLSKEQPAYVLIRLENISDKDIKFLAEHAFYLKNMADEVISRTYERVGDGYYSRSGMIAKEGQLVLVPEDLKKTIRINRRTRRFPNEEIYLRKGEVKQIKVDLAQLLWADRMSSVWPSENFFDLIQKGKYRLSFEMYDEKVKAISNQVDIQVE
jgi:hypothetical protein